MSEDGRWLAMLTDDDRLTVFDIREEGSKPWKKKGVSSAQFQENVLLTSDQNDQIAWYGFPGGQREKRISPNLSLSKQIYRYAVNPLYLVFPKPSELQNTMHYAFTGKDTQKVEGPGMGPNGRTVKLDPWQPIYSNSAFIIVMLLIGCIYIYRQDF